MHIVIFDNRERSQLTKMADMSQLSNCAFWPKCDFGFQMLCFSISPNGECSPFYTHIRWYQLIPLTEFQQYDV
jgi:hypothetical protein